jgi:hypothetical protein
MVMKHAYASVLICLGMIAGSTSAMAAEAAINQPDVVAQDLVKVRESGSVGAALWTRRADSYTLQLVYGASGSRGSFFIGNTIANLRGLDPVFGGRMLTLVDGRRMVRQSDGSAVPNPVPPATAQPVATQATPRAPKSPDQVWLLRSNGTQILPNYRSPEPDPAKCGVRCIAQEVTYKFSLADGDEAVAAVVRVDDEYYVEKLQPLKPAP